MEPDKQKVMCYPQFARILSQYLQERERSGSWLAQRIGVNQATVNRWLAGDYRPNTPEKVIAIAKALNINEVDERNALLMAAGYAYQPPEQEPAEPSDSEPRTSLQAEQAGLSPDGWEFYDLDGEAPRRSSKLARRWLAATWEAIKRWLARQRNSQIIMPENCGHTPIPLRDQTLALSTAFGMYFVGLLEREDSFVPIQDQLEIASSNASQEDSYHVVVERLLNDDARIMILASEGGMGKSTIAAQIIRCLFELEAVDVIIGDSAKSQIIDVNHGELAPVDPGYVDSLGFFYRLREQLGLPQQTSIAPKQYVRDIRDRLYGRQTVIFVDNLETVATGDQIMRFLSTVVSPNIRALVTTRHMLRGIAYSSKTMLVHLQPIRNVSNAATFLQWHIARYQHTNPRLALLSSSLDEEHLHQLIQATGGIPLLMQIVTGHVARLSWDYLDSLPDLFGSHLLDFLYTQAWKELQEAGSAGLLAKLILQGIARQNHAGHRITFNTLQDWFASHEDLALLSESLTLLYERFLIINNDLEHGNFAITPSLAAFVSRQKASL